MKKKFDTKFWKAEEIPDNGIYKTEYETVEILGFATNYNYCDDEDEFVLLKNSLGEFKLMDHSGWVSYWGELFAKAKRIG